MLFVKFQKAQLFAANGRNKTRREHSSTINSALFQILFYFRSDETFVLNVKVVLNPRNKIIVFFKDIIEIETH